MVISVFFSRSHLRGRWVSVTIITITSSPHGRCMCMMHNFAVHQFVTSLAAPTSYLHHFILPGWHGCISSLTSIRQRLRLGNLSLVIYVLDDDRSQNLSNRQFDQQPYLVLLTTTYSPSGLCAAFFSHNGCLKSQTRHYWLHFQQSRHSGLEVYWVTKIRSLKLIETCFDSVFLPSTERVGHLVTEPYICGNSDSRWQHLLAWTVCIFLNTSAHSNVVESC